MPDNALIIFIKNPVKGKVKTRLAATVGDERALAIYLRLLERTRTAALGCPARRMLYFSEKVDHPDQWPSSSFIYCVQYSGDLGERMEHAFRDTFESGARRVVIIGSDCPLLAAEDLNEAFRQLNDHDLVFGPAEDGGYYLMGMNQLHPELFRNKQWSTSTVLADSLRDAEVLGLKVHLLRTLHDVDTEEDWNRVEGIL